MSSSSHASGSPQGQGPDGALSDPDTRQRFPQLRLCGLLLVSGHDGEKGRECGNGVTAGSSSISSSSWGLYLL